MKKIHLYDTIISPIVTEKSTNLSEQNKIVFKVSNKLNKIILKKNIEKIFKVNVIKVNIINKQSRKKITRGKKVKIQGYKKAIGAYVWEHDDDMYSDNFVGDTTNWWLQEGQSEAPLYLQIGFPGPHPPFDPTSDLSPPP